MFDYMDLTSDPGIYSKVLSYLVIINIILNPNSSIWPCPEVCHKLCILHLPSIRY